MANLVKILLFSGFGANTFSKEMIKINEMYSFPVSRKELANFVEKTAIHKSSSVGSEALEDFLKDNFECIVCIDNSKYFIYNKKLKYISSLEIVEVDTSRPWTIEEYDGAEYIKYLDYEILDKELNYGKNKE